MRAVGGRLHTRAVHTVLVPPLLCSARVYAELLPAVWAAGSVSVADTRRDDTMAGIARRLLDEAPERFALVGTSMGGYVALETVRQAPERVVALGLISTSAHPDSAQQAAARRRQSDAARADFPALADAAFPSLVTPAQEQDAALRSFWRTTTREVGLDAFLTQQEAVIGRADSRPLLPAIGVPTAVVHGTGDRLIDAEQGRELAAAVPGARLTLVEGAGHLAVRSHPHEVAAAISALLEPA